VDTVPIDADEVAEIDLLGRQQVGQRVYEEALNGAFEVASTVPLVSTFLEEEIAAGVGDAEKELVGGGIENALLDEAEFDVEDGFEFGALELAEDDQLIEAVHKFRGELAASRFDGGTLDFLVDIGLGRVAGLDETVAAAHEVGDFVSAEIGRHEDDGLREIHTTVVAERERGLIEHAEE
jgi:hypothetical protein